MGISIDPTLPDRDWSGLVKPTAETVGHLLSLSFGDAASSAFESIKMFRAREETPEQRVWTLWRESLAIALPEFFVTAVLTRRPDDKELGRLLQDILWDSEKVAKVGRAEFEDIHLRTPTSFPLYPPLREKLPEWARKVAPEHLRDDERLRERLDRAFERGFRRAFADRGEHFKLLRDYFADDEAETGNRRDAWQRYYDGLSREIEAMPLFNQPEDGSGATLGKIFQPLRCFWRERARRPRRDLSDDEVTQETDHIDWLQSMLEVWLDKRSSSDALRVVTGGPGSGKSSSALWFARDVAYTGCVNVFVVRLQGLDVDRPIDAIVDEFVDVAGSDHGMLETSPLDWLRDDPKPLLLIFDGLDEVARPDGAGLEVTKTFLRTLHTRLGQSNREAKARLMALVLGRPQAAEEAALALGGSLEDRALLHVVPLSPLGGHFLGRDSHYFGSVIKDPNTLACEDFRAIFYERYRPFDVRCNGDGTPEALRDDGLADMTAEPLLLYLLIISGYAGDDWALAKDNRNRVYQRIFKGIHERDLKKRPGSPSKMGIEDEGDFFQLMECLGVAAWLGGGRSGSDEDFELVRDEVYLPERKGEFHDMPSARLSNVALQMFARRTDRESPGYAFIHKSFGEYLTARALVGAGERWCGDEIPRRPGLFAEDWLQFTGGARLTSDILRFMVDETRLRTAEPKDARNRIDALATIASHTLRHGFPADGKLVTFKGVANWRRREVFQRNAEESLYALIHSWAEASYLLGANNDRCVKRESESALVNVAWPNNGAAKAMLGRLMDEWKEGYVIYYILRHWMFSGQDLSVADLSMSTFDFSGALAEGVVHTDLRNASFLGVKLFGANLVHADLRQACLNQANLILANLYRAKLSGASLNNAILRRADLTKAKLSGADLSEADLARANLSMADLTKAKLSGADLTEANLARANLARANLSGANLSGTDLSGANLSGANLSGANLSGTDLSGTDCSRLSIDSARLQSANLSTAVNLTQGQIDKAYGNSETKLPHGIDGLQPPAHWSDDE